jgi:predicted Fe-S protein YdhL (DUF1289 family)
MSKFVSKSPCIDVCKFRDGLCRACGRTRTEKKEWKALPAVARDAIWQRVLTTHGTGAEKHARELRRRFEKARRKAGS